MFVSDSIKRMKLLPLVPTDKDNCLYTCHENRGCSVELISKTLISGSVKGSCFPPSFGSACSGTPDFCQKCSDVCVDRAGEDFLMPTTVDGAVRSTGDNRLLY